MIHLVLGGARSGKSAVAERIAARYGGPVTYLATMWADGDDADLTARIEAHQQRRPADWATIECRFDLPGALAARAGVVLIDSLTSWVAAAGESGPDTDGLCRALAARGAPTVMVSDEVGLSVHPSTAEGRHFRDRLGETNQVIAAISDEVLLVVAGRSLRLDR